MNTMLILLVIICMIFTPLYIIYKPPNFLIPYFQHRWRDVLWHVPTQSKIIALTIDDTPSEHTTEIMQILKANSATATFFVIGSQVAGRESILQDLLRNGNELANHAMYDEPSKALSDAVLADQIERVRDMLRDAYAAVGVEGPPNYFRPGSGFFSDRMCMNVRGLGCRIVLGSIFPHDPQVCFWRVNAMHVLSMLRPGAIVVCHDGRAWTAPMLKKVLPEMNRRGYRVVTVTELLEEART